MPHRLIRRLIVVISFILVASHAEVVLHTEQLLEKQGIELSAQALSNYLIATAYSQTSTTYLAQLASDNSRLRQEAMAALLRMPDPPLAELRQIADSQDADLRFRASALLQMLEARLSAEEPSPPTDLILEAIAEVIIRRRIVGCSPALLARLASIEDWHLIENMAQAAIVSVRHEDEPVLLRVLASGATGARYAAMRVLLAVNNPSTIAQLPILIDDADGRIRCQAAVAQLNLGDHEALTVLIQLLRNPDITVRTRSVNCLRNATGFSCGFLPWWQPVMSEQLQQWERWYEEFGSVVVLRLPATTAAKGPEQVIYTCFNKSVVRQVDANGKQIWQATIPFAMECRGLPLGHRLVLTGNSVISGEGVQMSMTGPSPGSDAPFLVQLDVAGTAIWSLAAKQTERRPRMGQFSHAEPLENGNILLVGESLIEMTRDGRIQAMIPAIPNPFGGWLEDGTKLPNGRYLAAVNLARSDDSGMLTEVNADGYLFWSLSNLKIPIAVLRKPDGHTVVFELGTKHLSEFTPEGKLVWTVEINAYNHFARLQNQENGQILFSIAGDRLLISAEGKILSKRHFTDMALSHTF